ncbi:Sulfur oxidation cycle carrier protein SoxY-Cys110-persulfide--sulfur compound transferase, SoxA subunit [uncultured Gammaproteobacteria bacterium]|uniref:sulfur oxidation c-type cytochrome SoxA n=1 Tax=Bathymodiolus heckerae thiotrophic gill symbiont TaxID=1052212 RepID=UPI0010B58772|nr:sulfur oxidation c-type cytochrome SoxA [Bathymodiolus heckerae thiotrophic gill symbiont]CAC9548458.1 Sulfur oxidation cycle carrier protein SoxY-Cys110-persulfide--sulfur compound transferase, SoxA subunit [uncultured Gammaproteobacteria bacterium]CAC9580590.1 Sulfur oxidation cycle carrier protein SoxY-Cys110-persulfide--sulfur compound transferase, SoxA subunit [uncultured Gammaproteobacteria bacterium]CAC9603830.1 Sulfur oxidation cycle carrier protein SoxY-Cys110-persulfide--sulfur comp
MKKLITAVVSLGLMVGATSAIADMESDRKALVGHFKSILPNVEFADYTNGVYAVDEGSREQFEEILDGIPPYEDAVEKGGAEYLKYGLNKCTALADPAVARVKHPYFDEKSQQVVTLEGEIKRCYNEQTGKKLGSSKGKIARISAWISDQAAGQKINVIVESAGAKAAYAKGKATFYAKRGQFNMSCADCHVYNASKKARADILSPALGHTTHVPMYRAKWSGMGTLHRRYGGCYKNMRAKPLKAQTETYRNMEFFHQAMSNGLEITDARYRK